MSKFFGKAKTATINTAEYTIRLNTDQLASDLKKADSSIVKTLSDISSKASKETSKGFDKISKIGTATTALIASAATKAFGSVTNGIKGFVSSAIDVSLGFEAGMSKVAAISGATGNDLAKLTAKAREMGRNTVFSSSEAADALSYMAMAGWKTQDMLNGIEGIMDLAAASGEDLATTSDIVTDALTAFGLTASDSTRFANVLAAASSNANTNVSMMGETFKYVAPVAGAMGYSIEDTATAIGLMANAGIKASQAGTSLRSIMQRLATNTDGIQNTLKGLGVTIVNEDGSMRNFGDTIDDLRKVFSGLSQEQQVSLAKNIAGTEAMSGLLAIVNAAPEDYEKLTDAINSSNGVAAELSSSVGLIAGSVKSAKGAAKDMSETMSDNVQGNLKMLNSALDETKMAMMEKFTPAMNQGIFGIKSFVGAISSALSGEGNIQEQIHAFIENFGQALVDGLFNLGTILGDVIPIIVEGLIGILPSLAQGLIDGITNMMDGLANKMPEILNSIVEAIINIADILTKPENLNKLLMAAVSLFKSLIDALPQVITELAGALPSIIDNIVTFFQDNYPLILDAVIDALMSLVDALPTIIGALANALPSIINAITSFLKNPGSLKQILDGAIKVFYGLIDALPTIIDALAQALPDIITAIVGFLTDPGTFLMILDAATTLFFALVNAVPRILGALIESFGSLVGALWNSITGMFGKFAENFGNFIGGIFKQAINNVLAFIEHMINGPIDILNGFISVINNAFSWIGVNLGKIDRVQLPRMYTGGIVPATSGGMPIIAGDGGEDEWVVPESKMASLVEQLEKRASDSVNGATFNIYVEGVFATSAEERRHVADQIVEAINQNNQRRFA